MRTITPCIIKLKISPSNLKGIQNVQTLPVKGAFAFVEKVNLGKLMPAKSLIKYLM